MYADQVCLLWWLSSLVLLQSLRQSELSSFLPLLPPSSSFPFAPIRPLLPLKLTSSFRLPSSLPARSLYLSTLLPLFQTRSKVRAQPSPPPAPHTQIPLGRCTLQIGPCTFPDTRIFEVRYTAPEDVAEARKEADERTRVAEQARKEKGKAKAGGGATGSTQAAKPASNANIVSFR